ncbi:sigma-70 family RNA polymerase sigma factor [Halobacillus kuroshimensis]|uniref:Sigma-70 family RNA polymerase sigma factor n=1 Tax=Halobacillus kuroshimensis TaxID=302481 RepID=A0ABS3DUV3_9BACI|nr:MULTISPECIES: sigma-70 family RNA polymerase sigma factor [Halobacillus]MBN8235101.1 sigma-70 family RNA polymerase sigma factor [Halobacillus kuroshimensis]
METEQDFEQLLAEWERSIHYHIRKLHIIDANGDFYAEGLFALWQAHRTYNPEAGEFSTYAHWKIRNALIDQIRRENNRQERENRFVEELIHSEDYIWEDEPVDTYFWDQVKNLLTPNQWKWVSHRVKQGRSVAETARIEGVTQDAVKNWGRHARNKLKSCRHLL